MAKTTKKHQAHGAINPDPVSIYDILGYKHSPYKTNSLDEYLAAIDKMYSSDIHEHAVSVGVIPTDDRAMLRVSLEKAFIKFHNQFFKSQPGGSNKVTKKGLEQAHEIMKRGK